MHTRTFSIGNRPVLCHQAATIPLTDFSGFRWHWLSGGDFPVDDGWSPAARLLVAERQILFDAINIGGSEKVGLAQRSSPFGTLALQQMASAGAPEQHFAGAGYLETFAH